MAYTVQPSSYTVPAVTIHQQWAPPLTCDDRRLIEAYDSVMNSERTKWGVGLIG